MSFWNSLSITTRYSRLPRCFFTYVQPTPLDNSRWLIWNSELAKQFDLPENVHNHSELLDAFSGETVPSVFAPLAMKYAGHQFGSYNPDLGDGRGLLLAEIKDKKGNSFDLHLKGAGLTPYSRSGDGRAVLRSTIREYLCSEAMAGLGIPTTRALGMMTSDTPVFREGYETGALLIRMAETHIRFGPFGFLDDYEPGYICNHSDYQGRYAFNQQPRIGLWNLSALAHSLSLLIDKSDLEKALEQYEIKLHDYFSQLMRKKLGLLSKQEGDTRLFESMFELLSQNAVDYTRFMRTLSYLDSQDKQTVIDLFVDREAATLWIDLYLTRCKLEADSFDMRCSKMRKVNPKYVLRNYLAQQAIVRANEGDFSDVKILSALLASPFDEHPDFERYAELPPEWGKRMEISCSS